MIRCTARSPPYSLRRMNGAPAEALPLQPQVSPAQMLQWMQMLGNMPPPLVRVVHEGWKEGGRGRGMGKCKMEMGNSFGGEETLLTRGVGKFTTRIQP